MSPVIAPSILLCLQCISPSSPSPLSLCFSRSFALLIPNFFFPILISCLFPNPPAHCLSFSLAFLFSVLLFQFLSVTRLYTPLHSFPTTPLARISLPPYLRYCALGRASARQIGIHVGNFVVFANKMRILKPSGGLGRPSSKGLMMGFFHLGYVELLEVQQYIFHPYRMCNECTELMRHFWTANFTCVKIGSCNL